jgi:hypothetical protein
MRPLLALPLLLLATSALAGWESGMVEDEGGPTMMAWVEGEGGDVPPELRMMCGDQVNLRYGMGSGPGEGVAPGGEPLPFTFDFGDATITLDMQYEEMDGAHAAYFAVDAPILGLLRSHGSVTVDDPTGTWRAQEFTLTGSSAAIAALLATCR